MEYSIPVFLIFFICLFLLFRSIRGIPKLPKAYIIHYTSNAGKIYHTNELTEQEKDIMIDGLKKVWHTRQGVFTAHNINVESIY